MKTQVTDAGPTNLKELTNLEGNAARLQPKAP
jgi:hypothetical protein